MRIGTRTPTTCASREDPELTRRPPPGKSRYSSEEAGSLLAYEYIVRVRGLDLGSAGQIGHD